LEKVAYIVGLNMGN